jgi:lactoylglutathione lyase
MAHKLAYVIEFVGDMDRAVAFYRDMMGLSLKFQSPGWSEFATGETVLGLHPASEKNPAGKVEMGFTVPDLKQFYADLTAKGVKFPMPPTHVEDVGGLLAQFEDSEGAQVSVGES